MLQQRLCLPRRFAAASYFASGTLAIQPGYHGQTPAYYAGFRSQLVVDTLDGAARLPPPAFSAGFTLP